MGGKRLPARSDHPTEPTLVVNGDEATMSPAGDSFSLVRLISDTRLSADPDSGHAGTFQDQSSFEFLRE
ncbi:hypothetical protein GCM10018793_70900 [Streptomyces sulfonofaciens]|uniref:Uncharacterized protein n=1 Tax=Streptomyces sulfonofaciens TaxID=68272 RepID=A0A919GSN8_9ACTN|nr:hypothetical protein [Streptomyces sulfonofaciens]GHH89071.1 hypothetical protein GCM10018793_70900 [Streptomyces sulfonofaciens]